MTRSENHGPGTFARRWTSIEETSAGAVCQCWDVFEHPPERVPDEPWVI